MVHEGTHQGGRRCVKTRTAASGLKNRILYDTDGTDAHGLSRVSPDRGHPK
jgi:hypothetical protein